MSQIDLPYLDEVVGGSFTALGVRLQQEAAKLADSSFKTQLNTLGLQAGALGAGISALIGVVQQTGQLPAPGDPVRTDFEIAVIEFSGALGAIAGSIYAAEAAIYLGVAVSFKATLISGLAISAAIAGGILLEAGAELVAETVLDYFSANGLTLVDGIEFVGDSTDQSVDGTHSSDSIITLGGDDIIFARGGNDTLDGGTGSDQIFGGEGDDIISGGADNDFLYGNYDEAPTQNPGSDRDTIHGGDGADLIAGGHDRDVLWGDGGDDVLYGFYPINSGVNDPTDKDELHGGAGNDYLYGQQADDKLFGDAGDDVLFGGTGKDVLVGGAGDDILHGGEDGLSFILDGTDTADYSAVANGINVVLSDPIDVPVPGLPGASFGEATVSVTDDGEGGFDWLLSIEEIIGTAQSDTVQFSSLAHQGWLTIDGGDQPSGEVDVVGDLVDLSALTTEGVVITPDNGIEGTGIVFRNFERLKGTDGADLVVLSGLLDQPGGTQNGFVWADLGAGNDRVGITGRGIEVFLGSGDDFVFGASYGSIIHTGEGNDVVFAGGNVLVTDADLGDRIHLTEDEALTGGIRAWLSESPWTTGKHGVRYGQNTESDLVIRDGIGQETFVQNYVGGPGVSNPTAGIQMGAIFTQAYRIFEPKPDDWIEISFETLDFFWKAMFGEPRKPWSDPLLLDLDGDGLELTARGFGSPIFDIDGDGFAEPTGWVSGDDGFLARDLNQNGLIDDVSELFGDATVDGFAALSALDSNLDGTIDAADTDFAELRIWRDLDQDGVTDAGELQTLTQAGIASIGLTTSAPAAPLNAQNAVTAVGTFTRTDATTGEAFNVEFNLDNFNSTFLGDTTVSPQAALLPQLKGHGTLPDLRAAA